jgi:hypothetical protein
VRSPFLLNKNHNYLKLCVWEKLIKYAYNMFSLKIVFIILIGNIRDTIVKSQRFHEILTSFPTLYGFKIII